MLVQDEVWTESQEAYRERRVDVSDELADSRNFPLVHDFRDDEDPVLPQFILSLPRYDLGVPQNRFHGCTSDCTVHMIVKGLDVVGDTRRKPNN